MKYAIRRALVGILSIPLVAGAYVFLYLSLLFVGFEPNLNVEGAFHNGFLIGIVVAIILTFYPQFSKFVDKLI